jgi:hypothetical protein
MNDKLSIVTLFSIVFSAIFCVRAAHAYDGANACSISPFNYSNESCDDPNAYVNYEVDLPTGASKYFSNGGYCGNGPGDKNDQAYINAKSYAQRMVKEKYCTHVLDFTAPQ